MRRPRKVDSLFVFAPIREGRKEALAATLRSWSPPEPSPMRKLQGTHMARFVIVPHLRGKHGEPLDGTSYLLYGSEFDGPAGAYLNALARLPEAREVFGHCAGYRDDGEPETLLEYLAAHRVRPGYSVVAYPEVGLDEVLRSLELRRELARFAVRTRGLDAAALKREWLATFAKAA